MKNLQKIKQQRGDNSISKDIDTIREAFQAGAYLLSGDNTGYDLDETHKLKKGENALIIITQYRGKKHSLVICSQGAFFDDVKVWSGEDIESLQAAVEALQETKQNVIDQTLATQAKSIAGAINEIFNGGVKDKSIEVGKLAQAVQDTLGNVGASVKVLSSGTDLKAVEKAGVYILSGIKDYLNYPNNWEHYNTAILIVSGDGNNYNKGKTIIGFQNGSQYPFAATLRNNEWIETGFDAIKYSYTPVPLTTTTSTNKTQLDLFISKVPNAQVMHVTYKDVYAGTLHKINGSWYGVLVGESNTLAGQLSIKLQVDGTIIEGTA